MTEEKYLRLKTFNSHTLETLIMFMTGIYCMRSTSEQYNVISKLLYGDY